MADSITTTIEGSHIISSCGRHRRWLSLRRGTGRRRRSLGRRVWGKSRWWWRALAAWRWGIVEALLGRWKGWRRSEEQIGCSDPVGKAEVAGISSQSFGRKSKEYIEERGKDTYLPDQELVVF